jgi:hypothetical protein
MFMDVFFRMLKPGSVHEHLTSIITKHPFHVPVLRSHPAERAAVPCRVPCRESILDPWEFSRHPRARRGSRPDPERAPPTLGCPAGGLSVWRFVQQAQIC